MRYLMSEEKKLQERLKDHDARMVLLKNHDIITNLIHEAIQNEPWPTTEPAEKQEFVLSRVEKQSLYVRVSRDVGKLLRSVKVARSRKRTRFP